MKIIYNRLLEFVQDIAETLITSFAIFIVAYWLLAQPFEVIGNSMLISFENGEHLVTDKITYRFREPQRGDVVVFKYPKARGYDYIKRIVGLPGETIKIEKGRVYIANSDFPEGFELSEPYLFEKMNTTGGNFIKEGIEIKIPDGNYVVLGDNRNNSSDSREWGFVPKDNIVGRAIFKYWPPQALAIIHPPTY